MSGVISRRRLLIAAAGAGLALGSGFGLERILAGSPPAPSPGRQPAGLPARQHAWDHTLETDRYGNRLAPRHNRLLLFDLNGDATRAGADTIETALRTLERTYAWGPGGLLFTLGWSSGYFLAQLGMRNSPVAPPRVLSDTEAPQLDDYAACLHLAGDDGDRLAAVEAALVHGGDLPGADGPLDLRPALNWRQTRTGFVGAGLPHRHQRGVLGIPGGDHVPRKSPLYMGFKSGFKKNQAGENAVTITEGPLTDGTTMQVSRLTLSLDGWYRSLNQKQRVAEMFGPQVSPADVDRFRHDAASHPDRFAEAARRHGVVGHAQATARARRNGRPVILRRDFNSTDEGQAGLHFVSWQRSMEDFDRTRQAMNATDASRYNPAIGAKLSNGIKQWFQTLNRATYAIPPRAERAFPLLDREEADDG